MFLFFSQRGRLCSWEGFSRRTPWPGHPPERDFSKSLPKLTIGYPNLFPKWKLASQTSSKIEHQTVGCHDHTYHLVGQQKDFYKALSVSKTACVFVIMKTNIKAWHYPSVSENFPQFFPLISALLACVFLSLYLIYALTMMGLILCFHYSRDQANLYPSIDIMGN